MTDLEIKNEIQLSLKKPPSLLYNNLVYINNYYIYASKNEAVFIKTSPLSPSNTHSGNGASITANPSVNITSFNAREIISNITCGTFLDKTIAFITTYHSTIVYDIIDGVELKLIKHDVPSCTFTFIKSGKTKVLALIGHISGEITQMEICTNLSVRVLSKLPSLENHNSAVSAFAVKSSTFAQQCCIDILDDKNAFNSLENSMSRFSFAAGDINGNISFWSITSSGNSADCYKSIPFTSSLSSTFNKSNHFIRNNDAVVSLAVTNLHLIAAFGCGKIRLFDLINGAIFIEIAAHSRWINSMALEVKNMEIAATCAEDGMICLWQLPTVTNKNCSLLKYSYRTNTLWTGCVLINESCASFSFKSLNNSGNNVVCAAIPHDLDKLIVYCS